MREAWGWESSEYRGSWGEPGIGKEYAWINIPLREDHG